jgi:hypothetical protein
MRIQEDFLPLSGPSIRDQDIESVVRFLKSEWNVQIKQYEVHLCGARADRSKAIKEIPSHG